MKWVQILNMVTAGFVTAMAAIMLLATIIEPEVLNYAHQPLGMVSVGMAFFFIFSCLYIGVRTIYLAIRTLFPSE
jgi:hypothetical protein